MNATAVSTHKDFDPEEFLATVSHGKALLSYRKKQIIFAQGGPCDAVFYIQKGKVKLSVCSKLGKKATIAILSRHAFFGEGCLTGQRYRTMSAIAVEDCTVMRIEGSAITKVLHQEHVFSDMFLRYLLARNVRYQEDLVDQLFNSSEKRLARALLLLAKFEDEGVREAVIPIVSQDALAAMVGTTRSRISFFMRKFKELGFINYDQHGLAIHSSLLDVVLRD